MKKVYHCQILLKNTIEWALVVVYYRGTWDVYVLLRVCWGSELTTGKGGEKWCFVMIHCTSHFLFVHKVARFFSPIPMDPMLYRVVHYGEHADGGQRVHYGGSLWQIRTCHFFATSSSLTVHPPPGLSLPHVVEVLWPLGPYHYLRNRWGLRRVSPDQRVSGGGGVNFHPASTQPQHLRPPRNLLMLMY